MAEDSKQGTYWVTNFWLAYVSLILNCQLHSSGDLAKVCYKFNHKQAIDYKQLQMCTRLI